MLEGVSIRLAILFRLCKYVVSLIIRSSSLITYYNRRTFSVLDTGLHVTYFALLGIVSLKYSFLISQKSANLAYLGIVGIKETLNSYLTLIPTTTGVLTLTLNLPYKRLPFTIFIDNLFTSYKLLSTLRNYSINTYGTT